METADKYAKFWLEPVGLATSAGYTAEELRRMRELVELNRELFLEKWHEYFSG